MDLFENADVTSSKEQTTFQPLAEVMRPKEFSDFSGLKRVKGYSSSFEKLIDQGHMQNLILWGPPGTGKTTFAELLAKRVDAETVSLNAVTVGVKALRETGELARRKRIEFHKKTIVFIDEIHRFSKSQQDVLLPFIEKGDFFLVGATTENPSYELNAALLSRCRLLVFQKLSNESLIQILNSAADRMKVRLSDVFSDSGREFLFQLADGDGRRLLNVVEPIFKIFKLEDGKNQWPVSEKEIEELSGQKIVYFDKKGDQHYDVISAFIKSIRGSDPNAGLYYLARMLEGGEDPVFIARRLVILASEDIGNGDPKALPLAIAGLQAVELIGLPECAINLAQVVTYLASAPKSNRSYVGLRKAQEETQKTGQLPVPLALRSGKGKVLKDLGYGQGYRYSHDGERGFVAQDFMPEEIKEKVFYEPSEYGFEKNIKKYLEWLRQEVVQLKSDKE